MHDSGKLLLQQMRAGLGVDDRLVPLLSQSGRLVDFRQLPPDRAEDDKNRLPLTARSPIDPRGQHEQDPLQLQPVIQPPPPRRPITPLAHRQQRAPPPPTARRQPPTVSPDPPLGRTPCGSAHRSSGGGLQPTSGSTPLGSARLGAGSGLLGLVDQVEAHGGRLRIESGDGAGPTCLPTPLGATAGWFGMSRAGCRRSRMRLRPPNTSLGFSSQDHWW
jgi:hypothetical protein